MEPSNPQMQRKSTQEIIDSLAQKPNDRISVTAAWYVPGIDFCFYAPAQRACQRSQQNLRNLKLQDDEQDLLQAHVKPKEVMDKILQIHADQQRVMSKRSNVANATSDFVNSFCAFADNISHIVTLLLPQSPEYTVTFGMLFILFKAVVTKKEREDSLLTYIQSIGTRLPLMEFYKTIFPTDALKTSVARVYELIMNLLDDAIVYYRSGRLSKLMDAMWHPGSNFDEYINNIDTELRTIKELTDAGQVAKTADIMERVTDTGRLVAKQYVDFVAKTNAISSSMEIVNNKLDALALDTGYFLRFEVIKHAQSLQNVLIEAGRDPDYELTEILRRGFHLSQKDSWENNGILSHLLQWSQNGRDELMWIEGTTGNNDTWVTELSTDIIQAHQPQLGTLLFIFCDAPNSPLLTAVALVRHLIFQLLELHPKLVYQQPDTFNMRRFQKAGNSFEQLWDIFEQLATGIPELFVLVDRIEACAADEWASVKYDLVPSLVRMAGRHKNVSVIVTSVSPPPEEALESELLLNWVYIDTAKNPKWK